MTIGVMVFNATFNNISAISWRSVLLVVETRVKSTQQRECFTFLCLGFAESQFNYGAGNENLGSYVEMYSIRNTLQ
jgi:hypothetical protein